MKCDQAAEFVSALCDGETILPAPAEHIGSCVECQQRLREYLEMGVELRRLASLDVSMPSAAPEWKREPRTIARYWRKACGFQGLHLHCSWRSYSCSDQAWR